MNALYGLCFAVTAIDHCPQSASWKGRRGRLFIWLFAQDSDDARAKAEVIIRQLPYEIQSPGLVRKVEGPDSNPMIQRKEEEARALGLAITFSFNTADEYDSAGADQLLKGLSETGN